ncbi:SCAN domain-containing protein 3 [Zootermopsis nevadensis]|uniref:SCAN domain-containing protein 3 n=1 Tax=Zootermopsis nevadensis TaxID=136037 RepID=A0A067QX00_ZOONE|nr:SCAN domain-containing protein 3 [Zootermopsis nevadensis]
MMELRSSSQCKMLFEEKRDHLESFWLTIHNEYPEVAGEAMMQLLQFPSTYMCEVGFSTIAFRKSTKRNCFLNPEYDVRCAWYPIAPNFAKLVNNMEQWHYTH